MSPPQTATPSPALMPLRRDLRFRLPAERILDWHEAGGPHIALFMNTLSLFFPVGERFFIDSVRHYRDRITDPELKRAVTAFIGQEAMHGREHQEYNEALFAAVPCTAELERGVARFLGFLQRRLPASLQLSTTIALEHFTAILADALLSKPGVLEGTEPHFAALWRWHALEETEHKAVAFDVWQTLMGRGPRAYVTRSGTLVVATAIFWAVAIPCYLRVLGAERRLTDLRGWRSFLRYGFTRDRVLLGLIGPWAGYFRPRFHPWDHDNRRHLADVERILAPYRNAA
ncbi:MAG: metal-dependent hydrolase [Nevskia sp.]|nr:metal-dependent hydrolase [Nevskia sp.]